MEAAMSAQRGNKKLHAQHCPSALHQRLLRHSPSSSHVTHSPPMWYLFAQHLHCFAGLWTALRCAFFALHAD